MSERPKCCTCGRFFRHEPGVAWKLVYSGGPIPTPDGEIYRCRACVERRGPFQPQPGINAQFSCGVET